MELSDPFGFRELYLLFRIDVRDQQLLCKSVSRSNNCAAFSDDHASAVEDNLPLKSIEASDEIRVDEWNALFLRCAGYET